MKLLHSIRLKGPWDYRWIEPPRTRIPDPRFPEIGRLSLPADWVSCFGNLAGKVVWSRRFQRPTNLDPDERVYLSLGRNLGIESPRINDTPLSSHAVAGPELRYNLTDLLNPSNLFSCTQSGGDNEERSGMYDPVVLEIWTIANE